MTPPGRDRNAKPPRRCPIRGCRLRCSRPRRGLLVAGAVLALLLVAGSASAVVSLEATSTKTGASDLTTLSVNHTTPPGQDRLLVATLAWDDAPDASVDSVDYAGDAMTCHDLARGTDVATLVCTLAAPSTGDHELNITWSTTVTEHAIVMSSYTGVHQTNPVGVNATATGSDSTANLTITTNRADATLVGGTVAETTGVSLTPRTGVTEDADVTAGSTSLGISHAAGHKSAPTAGSHDFGWNLSSSQNWASAAVEVHRTDHEVRFDAASASNPESTTSPSIGVSINESSNASISVDYAVGGGNASGGGDDYTLSSGSLSISAGSTSASIDLSVNDDTSDEPPESVEVDLSNPSTGTLTVGPSTHNYTISDDDANHAPNPSSESVSTDEDTSLSENVTATDQDQGDTVDSYAVDTSPSHGTISLNTSTGNYTYTPDADYNGADSFTFTATDNHGATSVNATVNITVNAVNDAPSAADDSASTPKNTTVWVHVLANDGDVDGDVLSVAGATSPSNGTTSVPGNGTVEYTPDPGFSGNDSFGYTVTDGSKTDSATVAVSVGSGGGPGGVEVLSSTVSAKDTTLSPSPTVNTTAMGSSLFIQIENSTGGIELSPLGASNTTTLEINMTVKNFTPTILMGRAEVVDWTNSTNPNGTQNVSFELQPISMAFIDDCANYTSFMGYCGPSSPDKWPTNSSEDEADIAFDAALRVFVSDLSYLNETMADNLRGGYMTTDAQALGSMNVTGSDSPGGASISIPVAGPHTLPDGTNNTGFFEARLPDALLDHWGISDPSALTGQYQGEDRRVTITDVEKGTEFRMDIHYSSGDVNITEDTTDPTADAGADKTVDVDESVSFDGSGSSDNQGITNYNWTFDDGSTGAGETTTHTYASAGTYEVTLNVSDGAGNTDTDTVNITVESTSSSGSSTSYSADIDVTEANLSATTAEPGENVTVTADVHNDGDAAGWHTVTFQAGNQTLGEHEIHVSIDETVTAEMNFSLDDEGTYEVTADDVAAGTLAVAHPDVALDEAALAGTEAAPNRSVTLTLTNPASVDRDVTLALRHNGTTVAETTLTLSAGEDVNRTLEDAVSEAGTYDVRVGGERLGNVTVAADDIADPAPSTDGEPAANDDASADDEPGDEDARGGDGSNPPNATPGPSLLLAVAACLAAARALRAQD